MKYHNIAQKHWCSTVMWNVFVNQEQLINSPNRWWLLLNIWPGLIHLAKSSLKANLIKLSCNSVPESK